MEITRLGMMGWSVDGRCMDAKHRIVILLDIPLFSTASDVDTSDRDITDVWTNL